MPCYVTIARDSELFTFSQVEGVTLKHIAGWMDRVTYLFAIFTPIDIQAKCQLNFLIVKPSVW